MGITSTRCWCWEAYLDRCRVRDIVALSLSVRRVCISGSECGKLGFVAGEYGAFAPNRGSDDEAEHKIEYADYEQEPGGYDGVVAYAVGGNVN